MRVRDGVKDRVLGMGPLESGFGVLKSLDGMGYWDLGWQMG